MKNFSIAEILGLNEEQERINKIKMINKMGFCRQQFLRKKHTFLDVAKLNHKNNFLKISNAKFFR